MSVQGRNAFAGEMTEAQEGNLPEASQLKVPDVSLEGTIPRGALAFII